MIAKGPGGGIMMHLADQREPSELRLKGSADGKNYIGLPGEPAGSPQDREIISFDGRVLITRFVDPDVARRFGYRSTCAAGRGPEPTEIQPKHSVGPLAATTGLVGGECPMLRWFHALLPKEERFFELFARHRTRGCRGSRGASRHAERR